MPTFHVAPLCATVRLDLKLLEVLWECLCTDVLVPGTTWHVTDLVQSGELTLLLSYLGEYSRHNLRG